MKSILSIRKGHVVDLKRTKEEVNVCVCVCVTGDDQLMQVRALNEWQLGGSMDWRTKLDVQRGAAFAAEIKNNACKMAKWAVCALLASADLIKFGSHSPSFPYSQPIYILS